MRSLKDDPKKDKFNSILIGVPTFGMVSINFCESLKTTGVPIFTSQAVLSVIGKPVDVARNEIAAVSLAKDYAFVWFRDDDVWTEYDALVKLFGRFSSKQRAKPRSVGEAIIGGVVYSKVIPPQPMIFRDGAVGGFEDWGYGDLVECDSIGMGAALVPVGVFRKILDGGLNEFQCTNDYCDVNWSVVHGKDVVQCPTCGSPLSPIFFKTVRAGEGFDSAVQMTEDTYFCLLAKDNGVKVFADCSVQAKHECTESGTIFYFRKELGLPVWEREGRLDFWPRIEQGAEAKLIGKEIPKGKKNGKVRFNLGSGGEKKRGYINVDLYQDSDFRCDVRDLRPLMTKYGQADEIYSSHVLEHVNRTAVTTTFRNWLKALKPGGKMKVIVPDGIAAMKDLIDADKDIPRIEEYDFKEAVVFGAQRAPGDSHQTAITENKMKKIIASCQNMIEKYDIKTGRRDGSNQDEIVVTVTKKRSKK